MIVPPSSAPPSPSIRRRDSERLFGESSAADASSVVFWLAISSSAPGGDGFRKPVTGLQAFGQIPLQCSTPTMRRSQCAPHLKRLPLPEQNSQPGIFSGRPPPAVQD